MEILLDEKVISETINAQATVAIKEAFSDYDVRKTIKEQVATKVIVETIGKALTQAASELDLNALTTCLAQQLQKNIVAATISMLREQCVNLMYNMEGGTDYDSNKDRRKGELRQLLKEEIKNGNRK